MTGWRVDGVEGGIEVKQDEDGEEVRVSKEQDVVCNDEDWFKYVMRVSKCRALK